MKKIILTLIVLFGFGLVPATALAFDIDDFVAKASADQITDFSEMPSSQYKKYWEKEGDKGKILELINGLAESDAKKLVAKAPAEEAKAVLADIADDASDKDEYQRLVQMLSASVPKDMKKNVGLKNAQYRVVLRISTDDQLRSHLKGMKFDDAQELSMVTEDNLGRRVFRVYFRNISGGSSSKTAKKPKSKKSKRPSARSKKKKCRKIEKDGKETVTVI